MSIFGLLALALSCEGVYFEVSEGKHFSITHRDSRGNVEYLECEEPRGMCGKRQWSLFLPLEEEYINKATELLDEKIRSGCWRSRSGKRM